MKILKFLLILIVSIIAIGLIAALFIKKDYKIEKEITINKPAQQVFDYIKYLKNQPEYSYWATLDTNMTVNYTGTDATVGFISSWKGNKDAGSGEQEIVKLEEGKKVDYALRFTEPMESNLNAYLATDSTGTGTTRVRWALYGSSKYPLNLMNPFMDRMMGDDLNIGLANLKKKLEAN
jgi:uncharacterized protein YndB with AHSA1/START domain